MAEKLRIYDMAFGETREVTQEDIDALVDAQRCLGSFLEVLWNRQLTPAEKLGRMVTIHSNFRSEVDAINAASRKRVV